jgi:CHAT domain-containing protein
MGLSSAFLALGTQTLVASVVPMPDAIARPLMVGFHRHLIAGASPAEALSQLQAGPGDDADPGVAAALGMLCFGAS